MYLTKLDYNETTHDTQRRTPTLEKRLWSLFLKPGVADVQKNLSRAHNFTPLNWISLCLAQPPSLNILKNQFF